MWTVDFRGIWVAVVTFLSAVGLLPEDEGCVGKVGANGTIDRCEDGDVFYGVIDKVDLGGGVSAVQARGFREVAYTGAPGLNRQDLVADDAGGVRPAAAAVAASLVTGVVANNNAIAFTAVAPGAAGNDISVALVDPDGNDQALSVDVIGRDIVVSLATGSGGAITSTAAEVIAAIEASAAADLVAVDNSGASTGAAAVAAVALADLAGGTAAEVGRQVFVVSIDAVAGTLFMDLG